MHVNEPYIDANAAVVRRNELLQFMAVSRANSLENPLDSLGVRVQSVWS